MERRAFLLAIVAVPLAAVGRSARAVVRPVSPMFVGCDSFFVAPPLGRAWPRSCQIHQRKLMARIIVRHDLVLAALTGRG